jgi:alginate O-acetyltransferase complex protein AlgI
MVFSSYLFVFYFLPVALGLYYISPRPLRHFFLTILSYAFYGWANPLFTVLMLVSTLIDYVCGLFIARAWHPRQPVMRLQKNVARSSGQKTALVISICSNLALLGFFKYFNFATDTYDSFLTLIGFSEQQLDLLWRVTLPLGISFYTFQSMSYSIDVYRGDARAIRNFIDFACYVSMFPQLVAGPIIRFQEVADQLRQRSHTLTKFARGAAFVCLGMSKKVLLANTCGKVADTTFNAGSIGFTDAWTGVIAYAFQIYFDFSGYSDIAIGLGLMLGFVFPKNFDAPYRAKSITEFWERWHISLSTWLRDYLYIPLGGNRRGRGRTYVNLMTVMVLGGLWHGASMNFLFWGAIHGGMLAVERMQGKDSAYRHLPGPVRMAITFVIVCFGWVFFRADTLPAAFAYCRAMLGLAEPDIGAGLVGGLIYQPYYVMWMTVAAATVWLGQQTWDFTRILTGQKALMLLGVFVLSLAVLTTQAFNPFIYFIF